MFAQVATVQPCRLDAVHQAVVMNVPHGAHAQARRYEAVSRPFIAAVANLADLILLCSETVVFRRRNLTIFCHFVILIFVLDSYLKQLTNLP